MNYELQRIIKVASNAQINIDLGKMGKVTKNRLIKAFDTGYLTSVSGDAALYHAILAKHTNIPIMQFSKKGSYWAYLHYVNMDSSGKPSLSDWWKADRVMYRLEKPEECAKWEREKGYYQREFLIEPTWEGEGSARILSGKDLERFDIAAQGFVSTESYQQKKQEVLSMIKDEHIITFNYEFK
jgi:hypothetical protein